MFKTMLDELSIDEIRWLKASEVLDFAASAESLHCYDEDVPVSEWSPCLATTSWLDAQTKRQKARSSKRLELRARHAPSSPEPMPSPACQTSEAWITPCPSRLPTPPSTPTRSSSVRNSPQPSFHDPSTQWLYRRPREPVTPRDSPAHSALSSSVNLSHPPPTKSFGASPSLTSLGLGPRRLSLKKQESPSDGEIKGATPFWSTVLRARSRSARDSRSLLKTIPSQSEVTVSPIFFERKCTTPERSPSSKRSSASSLATRPVFGGATRTTLVLKAPSISSSHSSSSTHSSAGPKTPVTPPDTYGARSLPKAIPPNKAPVSSYHHRYGSLPCPQPQSLGPPLSCSSLNKPILTRSSSVCSTRSVKFAEGPAIVHHAPFANETILEEMMHSRFVEDVFSSSSSVNSMMDVDSIDSDSRPHQPVSRTVYNRDRPRPYQAPKDTPSRTVLNTDGRLERNSRATEAPAFGPASLARTGSFRKLMALTTMKSPEKPTATANSPHYVPASACRSMPPPHARLSPTKEAPRPAISGPYALGSRPSSIASSPAASTTSLQSTLSTSRSSSGGRERPPLSTFTSTGASPSDAGSPPFLRSREHSTESACSPGQYSAAKGADAKSVRSLVSVKHSRGHATALGLKSLLSRIGTATGLSEA